MSLVFEFYPIGGAEMLLALSLADHADDDGGSLWPGVPRLARKTRQSERTVQYQLRQMEKAGYISRVGSNKGGRAPGKEKKGRSTEYRINIGYLTEGARIAPFVQGCKKSKARVQKHEPKGATAVAPNPPTDPSLYPPPHHHDRSGGLIYPRMLDAEREAIAQMLAGCSVDIQQQLVDELAGAIQSNGVRSIVPYARALVRAAAEGRFAPSLGVAIAAARQATATAANLPTAPFVVDKAAQATGERLLQKIREKANV